MSKEALELPNSNVMKLVKEAIDNNNASTDAKTAISKAGKVFVLYLSNLANDICQEKNKSTITAQHIYQALEELEFGGFINKLQLSLEEYKRQHDSKKDDKNEKDKAKKK